MAALDEALTGDAPLAKADLTGAGAEPAAPQPSGDRGGAENPFMKRVDAALQQPSGPEASPLWSSKAGRFLTGAAEPIAGAAQLAAHMTGYGEQTTDRWVKELEDFYQTQRRGAGLQKGDWDIPGGIGNALSPINAGPAAALGRASTVAGMIGRGAVAGGLYGATEPVHGGDYAKEKIGQVERGVGAGAFAGPAGELAGGAIDPLVGRIRQVQQHAQRAGRTLTPQEEYALAVRTLNEEGVETTAAMNWGREARRMEDWYSSVPFVGAFARGAEERMYNTFNRAAANRALRPLGEILPESVQPGHDAAQYVGDRLGREFDHLHQNARLAIDPQFLTDLNNIDAAAQRILPEAEMSQLENILQHQFIDKVRSLQPPTVTPGFMSGRQINDALSNVQQAAHHYSASSDASDQALGAALNDLRQIIVDGTNRHTPGAATVPNMMLHEDQQLSRDIARLNRAAAMLPPSQRAVLDQMADTWLHQPLTGARVTTPGAPRTIHGNDVKGVFSELAAAERGARGSDSWNQRDMGHFVGEIRDALSAALERQNPNISQPLRNANAGWANYVRLREAASKTPAQATEGRFTPTQLGIATRGLDQSTGHTASARGEALMQDLAEHGKMVMPKPMPNSGTPERTLMHGLLLGGAHFNPQAAALGMTAPIMYSEFMQNLMRRYAMSGSPLKGAAAGTARNVMLPAAALGVNRENNRGFADGGDVNPDSPLFELSDAQGKAPPLQSKKEASVRSFASGMTAGAWPYIEAAGKMLAGEGEGKGYDQMRREAQERVNAAHEQYPDATDIASMAGGFMPLGPAAKAGLAPAIGRGAAYGGLSGYLAPEAPSTLDVSGRAQSAGLGALLGGLGGGTAQIASSAGRNLLAGKKPFEFGDTSVTLGSGLGGIGEGKPKLGALSPEEKSRLGLEGDPWAHMTGAPRQTPAPQEPAPAPMMEPVTALATERGDKIMPRSNFHAPTAIRFVHPDSELSKWYSGGEISGAELYGMVKNAISGTKAVAGFMKGVGKESVSAQDFINWARGRHDPNSNNPRENRLLHSIQDAEAAGYVAIDPSRPGEWVRLTPLGQAAMDRFANTRFEDGGTVNANNGL